ncbi:uncharacterized protein L203_102606 [Cryptococcus depauperatus CBS 7841]|uniref:Uncharacterized protein n=1 Tax=Cryptococcus depauperatus CBS 7841 TaxID=1295531 RepID=A0A1E3IDM4_9TREE|nr:hypothetical protein L203_03972 [Cryptococcus depauperatus CBS 7841]ODO04301.1 hypothetical protein L204_00659 [Cryptococcus depauperatus CBS 7855]
MSDSAFSSSQRIALITGCSSSNGIASNIALSLLSRGYYVFCTVRKTGDLDHMKGKETCEEVIMDVVDAESIKKCVHTVSSKTGGRLDVLVNNAGVDMFSPLLDTSIESLRTVFEINTIAPISVTQAFAPLLVETARLTHRKSVVLNVGSMAKFGVPWKGAYCSSKAALECLTDVLRMEMAGLNVKVINLHVGSVKTDMFDNGKLFPTLSSTPSGFYPAWPEIKKRIEKDSLSQEPLTSSPARVGEHVASKIDSVNPPGYVRTANGSLLLDMAMWALSMVGLKDWFWGRMWYTWMVGRPQDKKTN